jgi:hypothetical protein
VNLVDVKQGIKPFIIEKSLVYIFSHDGNSRLIFLQLHQSFSFERTHNSSKPTEDRLVLFEDKFGHHHHKVLVERRSKPVVLLVLARNNLKINFVQNLKRFRVDVVFKGIFKLFFFRNILAIDILRLIFVEKRLIGCKNFERFTVDHFATLIKQILRISEEASHQSDLL